MFWKRILCVILAEPAFLAVALACIDYWYCQQYDYTDTYSEFYQSPQKKNGFLLILLSRASKT